MGTNSGQTPAEFPFIRLSLSARYALSGMLFLARSEGKYRLVEEASRAQDLPKNFLGKIFQRLTRQGLLVSQRGPGGGYSLAKPAGDIFLARILQVVEDAPAGKRQCFLEPHPCGKRGKNCAFHGAVVRADKLLRGALSKMSLKDLT